MRLNLDAGERDDETATLWQLFDIVCIACGGHAGDRRSMRRVLEVCASTPTLRAGAHPSYPDRDGFGRRPMSLPPNALAAALEQQLDALATIAAELDVPLTYVKPHGALYHDATRDEATALAVVEASGRVLGRDVALIGASSGALAQLAAQHGIVYLREGFCDRRMRADGTLVPRSEPDALITDPDMAVQQARRLSTEVDTISMHADTPGALAIARAVHRSLRA